MNAIKQIESWQIKKMFAISKNLGMDKGDLYAMANAESLKELSYRQASEVLARLEQMQGTYAPPAKKSVSRHKEIAGMMTEGQQRKAWQLMYDLRNCDKTANAASLGDRLCGIIKRELKVNATPEKPFTWIDYKNGNRLIEILKKYVSSAQRKSGEVDERN